MNVATTEVALAHSLAYDPRPLEEFKANAASRAAEMRVDMRGIGNRLPLHIFEWNRLVENGAGQERFGHLSPSEIENDAVRSDQVRIIFAPRDEPKIETANGLAELFEKFDVPRGFVAEGLQRVSQSFGTYNDNNGTEYIWFHLLFKDVATTHDHSAPSPGSPAVQREDFSKPNFSWIKAGFVLKIEHQKSVSVQSRSTSASSVATLTNHGAKSVTLLSFGAPIFCSEAPTSFLKSFQILKETANCNDLLQDPFVLLRLAFDEMHRMMDDVGWYVANAFGEIEKEILGEAMTPVKVGEKVNFTRKHNIIKHAIYLQENNDSALKTLEYLLAYHKKYIGQNPTALQRSTRAGLKYRRTLFQSTQARLSSLDRRMGNVLQLSFHLVTQRDSRIQQSESLSMKMIAAVTLFFMPLGTVASVFGSQLIRTREEKPYRMVVSQDFWVIWIISVPLMVLLVIICQVWYQKERAQLRDEDPDRKEGNRGYMGWNQVSQNVRRRIRSPKQAQCELEVGEGPS